MEVVLFELYLIIWLYHNLFNQFPTDEQLFSNLQILTNSSKNETNLSIHIMHNINRLPPSLNIM